MLQRNSLFYVLLTIFHSFMNCSHQDTEGLNAASAQEAHVIKGKKVTCKKAEAKQGKIYVGKLPTEGVSVEDIQNYFAQVSFSF